jgi:hypothetical protein
MVNLLRLKVSNNLLSLADCASSALRARSSHPSHAVGLELLGQAVSILPNPHLVRLDFLLTEYLAQCQAASITGSNMGTATPPGCAAAQCATLAIGVVIAEPHAPSLAARRIGGNSADGPRPAMLFGRAVE